MRVGRAWSVPVAAAAVVAAGAVAVGGLHPDKAFASQHPSLPTKTPQQLLVAVEQSKAQGLSGTVTEQAHWGLPSLPGATDSASLSWQNLLTGAHTVRVAVSGPDRQRLAVLGSLSESDLVRDGNDVWTYTSSDNSYTHSTLPASDRGRKESMPDPAAALSPQGAAQQLLKAVDPTTRVTVDPTQRVAGRTAYTLVLTPKDSRSTVRKVAIALDSQYYVPLRVQLFGASSTPAFQLGFTSISFKTPAASTFTFTPPAGATLGADPFGLAGPTKSRGPKGESAPPVKPVVLGRGWTSVLELPAAVPVGSDTTGPRRRATTSPTGLLNSLTSPLGVTGDRVLRTAVVNALLTKDGRLFVGAVPVELLQSAAAGTYK